MKKITLTLFIFVLTALPMISHATPLTKSDIDQYLNAYPATNDILKQITKKMQMDDK